jgi:phosphoglycerol transferase MdoB-like AlkP superfamily enzyme
VVVIIVESLAQEYVGALNEGKGYTPFIDSLLGQSLTFAQSFGNGRKSIDAMPSVLSSIPYFVEPYFLSSGSLNTVGGIAASLKDEGYYSAFFHGAPNGSMGFEAFAGITGFQDYYGLTQYAADPRYGGEADFDGTWAIWDEPFMQFMADKMGEFRQPFVTALFTATSHHPFVVPPAYKDKFPKGTLPIHQCIGYTDHALRQFFAKAATQEWFRNTLFVLTADHVNVSDHKAYQTDLGTFRIPLLFYAPADPALRGRREGIAQQIDVMPTVLAYLGYDRPYLAFGQDLLHTPPEETFAVNYLNGIYQYTQGDFLLQFDGERTTAVYNYATDPLLTHNLLGKVPRQALMERALKALVQQYMMRMTEDRLVIGR